MTEYDTEPQILGDKKKSFWKTFPILSEGRSSPTAAKQRLQDLGLFWRIISGNREGNKASQQILLLNTCCMLAIGT